MKHLITILLIIFFTPYTNATEYIHILNDHCINELFESAQKHFFNTKIKTIRDSRGIILRLENIPNFYFSNSYINSLQYINKIEEFLAKIENPAIIEVHTGKFPFEEFENLKNWEVSTVIANNIENIITKPNGTIDQRRINSVGYGEFLPAKNTPNNGGNSNNRIDIIILCNISGE